MTTDGLPAPIAGFIAAVNDRNMAAVGDFLTDDIVYHLIVPYPPATGRVAVLEALGNSVLEADRVRWEVLTWSATGDLVFVERIDHFWFAGQEAAIECAGVMQLREGRIAVVRDYADLTTWRARKAAALAQ